MNRDANVNPHLDRFKVEFSFDSIGDIDLSQITVNTMDDGVQLRLQIETIRVSASQGTDVIIILLCNIIYISSNNIHYLNMETASLV